jgi:hypothetical protein
MIEWVDKKFCIKNSYCRVKRLRLIFIPSFKKYCLIHILGNLRETVQKAITSAYYTYYNLQRDQQ